MKKRYRALVSLVAMLAAVMLARCAMLGYSSKAGQAPGLASGALTPCPDKPNCVSSEFEEDASHAIAPLEYSGVSPEKAWGSLTRIVEELGGEVVIAGDDYIAATFASSLFGFVDDVEFRLDASKHRIQVRSASRVGHSDLGVNRKRVEAMRRSFDREMGGGVGGGAVDGGVVE